MVVPIIKEIIKFLRPMLPSTIRIKQDINIKDALILADATQVHQVLINLCTNAAHAMREKGGTLTIGLKQIEVRENNSLLYDGLEAGTYLELLVADTGHGIDEKIQSQIFNPFFTTKKSGEGTGMGLAVVHGVVQNYRGKINLKSTVGAGTAFFIYLPLLRRQSTLSDDGDKEAKTGAIKGGERILLVDDQDFLLKMMSISLSRLGYKVTASESSVEALKLFQSDPFAFDLVITDQTMPFMTGADMAKNMLLIRPAIPIILCTGFSTSISSEQARVMGIRRYVMKPVMMNEFACLIRDVLEDDQRQDKTDKQSL
jgi:two-component system, cell cycle sensor histidine kinase and response regulator CckA